jgi:hypothetical protein
MPRLQINFASTPFINRMVPLAALAVLAFLALALTVTNLTLFAVFGGEYRTLRSSTAKQQVRIATLTQEIQGRRKEIASPAVATFMGEAVFLDGVLRMKSFSWTLFLSRLEEAKSYGIMLQSVNPTVEKDGKINVTLRGVANPRDELLKFENNLFRSNYFRNATLRSEQKDLANPWTSFDIVAEYDPNGYPPQPLPPHPATNAPAEGSTPGQAPVQGGPAPPGPPKAPGANAFPAPAKSPVPLTSAAPVTNAPIQPPAPTAPISNSPPKAVAPRPAPEPGARVGAPALKLPGASAGSPTAPRGIPSPTKAPKSNPGTPPPAKGSTNTPSGGVP